MLTTYGQVVSQPQISAIFRFDLLSRTFVLLAPLTDSGQTSLIEESQRPMVNVRQSATSRVGRIWSLTIAAFLVTSTALFASAQSAVG